MAKMKNLKNLKMYVAALFPLASVLTTGVWHLIQMDNGDFDTGE